MMYLILAETDPSLIDPEQMNKAMEMIKKDLDSGEAKIWGMSPDGRNSFLITTQDEKTILANAMIIGPGAKFKVMPMLSFDEAMEVMKEMEP